MKFTRHFANWFTQARARSLFCLVAALLLEAPLVAGLAIASGACCTGDHCLVAAHHHAAAKTEESAMPCEHPMDPAGPKVRSCSMSCCSTADQAALHANPFLPEPVMALASIDPLAETVSRFAAAGTAASFAPLSPPPRSFDPFI